MNFNQYVTRNKLVNMLDLTNYKFNQLYTKDLPKPILLGGNKVPLYLLADMDDLLNARNDACFFNDDKVMDLTDWNKAKRHYNSDMNRLDIPFMEYVTVTDTLQFIPMSKQAIQQREGYLPNLTVWGVKFYHKNTLKKWVSDPSRLERIEFEFETIRKGEFYKLYKTYDKWLKALNRW